MKSLHRVETLFGTTLKTILLFRFLISWCCNTKRFDVIWNLCLVRLFAILHGFIWEEIKGWHEWHSNLQWRESAEQFESHTEQVWFITQVFLVFKILVFIILCPWFLVCSRTFLSIIAGVLAGIIGFTGLTGFVFYFVVMLITSVGLMAKAGFSADLYFDSWNRVLFDGFLGGLMVCPHFLFSHILFLSSNCKLKFN